MYELCGNYKCMLLLDKDLSSYSDHGDLTGSPDAEGIRKGLKWLVEGAQSGDKLFLHYSGHGTQSYGGSEEDGKDECIVSSDMDYILDDEIKSYLAQLPKGCELVAVMDCCHSGTIMDLKYTLRKGSTYRRLQRGLPLTLCGGRTGQISSPPDTDRQRYWGYYDWNYYNWWNSYYPSYKPPVVQSPVVEEPVESLVDESDDSVYSLTPNVGNTSVDCKVIMISGCADTQTSADATFGTINEGALSHYLIAELKKGPMSSFELLNRVRKNLKDTGFSQIPQLSFSRKEDYTIHLGV